MITSVYSLKLSKKLKEITKICVFAAAFDEIVGVQHIHIHYFLKIALGARLTVLCNGTFLRIALNGLFLVEVNTGRSSLPT